MHNHSSCTDCKIKEPATLKACPRIQSCFQETFWLAVIYHFSRVLIHFNYQPLVSGLFAFFVSHPPATTPLCEKARLLRWKPPPLVVQNKPHPDVNAGMHLFLRNSLTKLLWQKVSAGNRRQVFPEGTIKKHPPTLRRRWRQLIQLLAWLIYDDTCFYTVDGVRLCVCGGGKLSFPIHTAAHIKTTIPSRAQ